MLKKLFRQLFVDYIDPEVIEQVPAFKELRENLRKRAGLPDYAAPKVDESLKPKVCNICRKESPGYKKFCIHCKRPFDQFAAVQVDWIIKTMEQLVKVWKEKKIFQ